MDLDSVRYIFDTSVLKKGDILLINTYNERLQERMKSKFDHVALYAGDAFIIESDGGGVVLNHIFSYGFCDITDAIVLRLDKYSELICEGVLFYARCAMGMEFGAMDADLLGAALSYFLVGQFGLAVGLRINFNWGLSCMALLAFLCP